MGEGIKDGDRCEEYAVNASTLKKNLKIISILGALGVALAISIYYNAIAPLPPYSIIGLVVHKDEGLDIDDSGSETPRYSVSIYLFTDDKVNDHPTASASSYRVDKEDFNLLRINDVVKARIVPGPFKGFEIADVFEVIPAKDAIDETIAREYPEADEARRVIAPS